MIVLIWTAVLIAALILYLRKAYSRFSSHGVKNPAVVPFFGNMLRMLLGVDAFATDLDKYYKNYPDERFVGRYEFLRPNLIVRDLDLAKKIAIKDFDYFLDHRGFTDEEGDPLFSRNLFSLKGHEWKDMRSTLSPAFTSAKIKLMIPFMEEVGEQMIHALKKKISDSPSKAGHHGPFEQLASDQHTWTALAVIANSLKLPLITAAKAVQAVATARAVTSSCIDIDCKNLTIRYASDVIASCAFGLKVDSLTQENNKFFLMGKKASGFQLRQIVIFFIMSACPIVANKLKLSIFSRNTQKFFIDLVLNTMRDREARHIIRPDMIHLLMEAKKGKLLHDEENNSGKNNNDLDAGFATVEESEVGKKRTDRVWSDIDLIAQAMIFLIAGFEAISIGMSFALHELALHPNVQERLYQEIKEHDAKNGGKLSYTSIQSMVYLDMVVSEVLRLWTPGFALDRVCIKDYNMGKPNAKATHDYIIRKGEVVWIPTWCFHRDPKYFPNPEKFDPERFSDVRRHLINPMAYIPFGVGPRNCIGSRFALCEIKVALYQILLHFEVSPSAKLRLPVRLSAKSFNPRLAGGHWVAFRLRA